MGVPAGVVLANLIFLDHGRDGAAGQLPGLGLARARSCCRSCWWRLGALHPAQARGHRRLPGRRRRLRRRQQEAAAAALAAEKGVSLDQAKAQLRAAKGSPILKVLAKTPEGDPAGRRRLRRRQRHLLPDDHLCGGLRHRAPCTSPRPAILWAVVMGSLLSAPFLPLTAWLSDRVGRRGVFMAGAVLAAASGRLAVLPPARHRRVSADAAGDRRRARSSTRPCTAARRR